MRDLAAGRGFSLIEVMIAMAVFSVGMLGIGLMQIKGAQFTAQAGARSIVVIQSRSLVDAMRANPAGVWGVASAADIEALHGDLRGSFYAFDGNSPPQPGGCPNQACATAKKDLAAWLQQLTAAVTPAARALGSANKLASVKVNPNLGTLTVTTTWEPQSVDAHGTASYESYAFDYRP